MVADGRRLGFYPEARQFDSVRPYARASGPGADASNVGCGEFDSPHGHHLPGNGLQPPLLSAAPAFDSRQGDHAGVVQWEGRGPTNRRREFDSLHLHFLAPWSSGTDVALSRRKQGFNSPWCRSILRRPAVGQPDLWMQMRSVSPSICESEIKMEDRCGST